MAGAFWVATGVANKHMVLTLPAIKGLCKLGFVLPVRARAGRTCEALG